MPMRDEIIRLANWWAEPDPYAPTVDDMLQIFEGAGCEQMPTKRDIEWSLTQDYGMRVGGQTKHWCGIFAAFILKSAGLDVRWTLNGGKIVGSAEQIKFKPGKNGIQPGDVAVIHAGEHHFIITDVQIEDNVVRSVDGNAGQQRIRRTQKQFKHDRTKAAAHDIYGYYQVLV